MLAYPSFPDLVAEIIRAANKITEGLSVADAAMVLIALGIAVVGSAWAMALPGHLLTTVLCGTTTLIAAAMFVLAVIMVAIQLATGGMTEPTSLRDVAIVTAAAVLTPVIGLKVRRYALDYVR